MSNKILDTTGHLCPIPVLKARRAIGELKKGEVLVMHATDNGAKKDVPNFCEQNGHTLQSVEEKDGLIIFSIVKG